MNRLPFVLILVLFLLSGCRKTTDNLVWASTIGTGEAIAIKATADSGIISCGELGGKPYLIKLDRNRKKISDFQYPDDGIFTSVWFNSDFSIATGSSGGKMLISFIDNHSRLLWDTTFSSSFNIDYSTVCSLGNGNLFAIGSANPDSSNTSVTGLICVWFDTTGTIKDRKEIKESLSLSANKVISDNSGNIYIALTRHIANSQPRATVAKYNSVFQKLWETEFYNNPDFGSSSLGITIDNFGSVYVSGKTKLPVASSSVDNSFCAKLENTGTVIWKKYLENSNSGSSILLDENGHMLILNRNCFIINVLSVNDGSETGIIRTFNGCDSNTTHNFGSDLDINYDGNVLIAGSKSGGFYIVMKSSVSQNPL